MRRLYLSFLGYRSVSITTEDIQSSLGQQFEKLLYRDLCSGNGFEVGKQNRDVGLVLLIAHSLMA